MAVKFYHIGKMLALSLVLTIFSSPVFSELENEGLEGTYARSIQQVLSLDEDEVDLATAVIIISERWNENVPGRNYLRKVNEMAYGLQQRMEEKNIRSDYKKIQEINKYLFEELGFSSVAEADNPNDLFLHSVLDRKKGYCLSLSVLYLSIGERLGLPLYGVVVPGHFFVRYEKGNTSFNIETTSNGGITDDDHYLENFDIPDGDNIYLANLNKRQTLGCFFNNLGNCYKEIGDTKSALLAFERAIEINPSLAESHTNLGNVYLDAGQIEKAMTEYKYALDINPFDAKIINNLGNIYSRRGWYNDAVNQYLKAIRLDPNFTDAYKNLANSYHEMGRNGQAIYKLKEALDISPDDDNIYNQMGSIYFSMNRFNMAINRYEDALDINPLNADAYYGLGLCYEQLEYDDEALQAYRKSLEINSKMIGPLINIGNKYFKEENFEKAIEYYEKAKKIKPDDSLIFYNLGTAYCNIGEYEKAVREFKQSLRIDPENGDSHHGLAITYFNMKKYDLAGKHVDKALELGINVPSQLTKALHKLSK